MGNASSSSTTSKMVKDERGYVFEPLVEHKDEVQARIAEAFYFPGTPKTDAETPSSKKDDSASPYSETPEGSMENGLRKADEPTPPVTTRKPGNQSPSKSSQTPFDPFCNLKKLEGWSMVVHRLSTDDTLAGLSLKYGVSTDVIRRANFMTDDRLVSYTRLIIPTKNATGTPQDEDDRDDGEEVQRAFDTPVHRKRLIQLLTQMDTSNLGDRAAEYYLIRNGFNLRHALQEVDSDTDWERHHPKEEPEWMAVPREEDNMDLLS